MCGSSQDGAIIRRKILLPKTLLNIMVTSLMYTFSGELHSESIKTWKFSQDYFDYFIL